MADPHDRVGVAPRQGAFWWLRGRAGRREYWAYVAALVALSLMLRWVPPAASLVGSLVLAFVQVRRLHDFDRSGWWAAAAMFAPLVPGLAVYFVTQSELTASAFGSLAVLAGIVWIGAVPGTAGDNRFGPAPPFTVRRVLTGR